ncbi:MAG: 6-carboxytetrahydropterin synthase [Burkholderiales bacterium]|nr:6-pyruvoyl tetrahydropterin synthase [Ferrovum sp.]
MKPQLSHWAAASFEAARRLTGPGVDERSRRQHGHSFRVELRTSLEPGWGGLAGAESQVLQQHLQEVVAALDYQDLNTLMNDPADDQILRWISQRLALPAVQRLHLWAGPACGATLDGKGRLHGWLRDRFESAHRLPNVSAGHKCGRMHGHGFEVILWVRGLSPNFTKAWGLLRQRLHLACLNDIEGLENPTSEMLSSWIWRYLITAVPALSAVTVFETASCGAVFDGQRYHIWKDRSFDSATRLHAAPAGDPRGRLHGHTYVLRLGLSGPLDRVMGWTVDFGDVKSLFSPVFRQLDHYPLHETLPSGDNAAIAHWIHKAAAPLLPALDRIALFDTPATGTVLAWGAAATSSVAV